MIQSSFKYLQKINLFIKHLKVQKLISTFIFASNCHFNFFLPLCFPTCLQGFLLASLVGFFVLFKLLMYSFKINFSNRRASVLYGAQVRAGSTEAKVQAAFHRGGSCLNDIALQSKKKCLSSLLGIVYQSFRLFQMRHFYCSPVNNVYFQIH